MTYTSNAKGVATVDLELADFSVTSSLGLPVAYRTFVVHDESSARIGCGIVGDPTASVASIGTYPGYAGANAASGTIAVTEIDRSSGGIFVFGTLTGLEASVTGGIHIHSGVSCTTTDGPAGHYWPDMNVDPWLVTTYTSDASGVASLELTVDDYTLNDGYPVAGRTVVVHDAAGARIGCGVIESTAGEIATLGAYPAVADSTVTGTALVAPCTMGVEITATVGGLEASTNGGFHIHSGFSVDATVDNDGASATSTSVGGHFWVFGNDPWNNVKYTSNANGVASLTAMHMENFTMNEGAPVLYHPLVVHKNAGARSGAGLISTAVAQPPTPDEDKKDDDDEGLIPGLNEAAGLAVIIAAVLVTLILICVVAVKGRGGLGGGIVTSTRRRRCHCRRRQHGARFAADEGSTAEDKL